MSYQDKTPEISQANIPAIARGEVIPPIVEKIIAEKEEAEERAKRAERRNFLYFIGGLLGTLAGTIVGWLLSKFC